MKFLKASMNLTNYFDIARFWLLLKMEVSRSRKAIGMTLVITFGLLFLIGLLVDLIVGDIKIIYDHHDNYVSTLFIGGFILSSLAFNDLSNTLKKTHYLTLPVSTFERFICMWLLTSVGWLILFTITYKVYTLLANPIGHLLFRYVTFNPFETFSDYTLTTMRYYVVLQGIFLVGAAHFKGYVFPKTLFILVLFSLISGIIAYFTIQDSFLFNHECTDDHCEVIDKIQVHKAWLTMKCLFWWVLAPLSWVITYLALREQEV